ncbi:Transposon TX1 uncharacterized 149 kDa protein [Vitis vinifera]|uniref:Transposon TX1 uncharacterized 149 kDa protein n=1 Tax=Vitis vinifera TaxID=29760 RepID=A0A438I9X2_VITVI|nr:Transposon TX1 uncharacterized 149 kDa protein [Vitis vinifera]
MEFFKDFHDRGRFVKSINASFLVLIPKKGGAEDLKDFRPISLVGSFYKLVKTLANRLKKVMGKIVSKSQNAFVEGRQIMDASLIVNEAIDSMQRSGGGGILCKLDIEKEYDHVNWSFLLWLLERMGFGAKWISWIQWCIGSQLLVEESEGGRVFSGGGRSVVEEARELKVNLDKSEIISVGRVENVEDLALKFGSKVSTLPSSNLGLPLGARFKELAVWDGVEERFRKRLPFGKDKQKGGLGVRNLTLLNRALLCSFGVGLWKAIGRVWDEIGDNMVYSVGNGRKVEDVWCHFGEGVWAPGFSRRLNDWEVFDVKHFFLRLQGRRVYNDVEDQVVWTKAKDGRFSIKSHYKALESKD